MAVSILIEYYDRMDISEGIDFNKPSKLRECDVCHCYFWDKMFRFHPYVWNKCHDVFMVSMNLSDIAILNINSVCGCCIISEISKGEAINLLQKLI